MDRCEKLPTHLSGLIKSNNERNTFATQKQWQRVSKTKATGRSKVNFRTHTHTHTQTHTHTYWTFSMEIKFA